VGLQDKAQLWWVHKKI